MAESADLSVYVHVPFCTSKCSYCDFYSITGADNHLFDRYTRRLIASLADGLERQQPESVDTIFIGGGTPSLLRPEVIGPFLENIISLTGPVNEMSIEVNPESLTAELLEILNDSPVDRISMGVQTYSDELLQWLGRPAGRDSVDRADRLLASLWKGRLNRDILAALPEGGRNLVEDLALALRDRPEHLSLYELTVEPGTRLAAENRLLAELPDVDLAEQEWEEALEYVSGLGYQRYEVSNFSTGGEECRHNLRYWNLRPYLGVGPSAASTIRSSNGRALRREESRDLFRWLEGADPEEKLLEAGDFLLEHYMMGLRTSEGLSAAVIESVFGLDIIRLIETAADKWGAAGLLSLDHGYLHTANGGMNVLDAMLADIAVDIGRTSITGPYNWPALTVKYGA